MNASPRILVTASILFLAAPAVSLAAESAAMDACVDAFVNASLPKEQKITIRKLDVSGGQGAIHGTYTISLTARSVNSGKRLAAATCLVERDGAVISLDGKPILNDAKATLTSR